MTSGRSWMLRIAAQRLTYALLPSKKGIQGESVDNGLGAGIPMRSTQRPVDPKSRCVVNGSADKKSAIRQGRMSEAAGPSASVNNKFYQRGFT